MFFAIVAPDRRHDSELLGVAHRVFHQALGLDVEADQQAHRSKCTASLGRMPAWSRGCFLAHMVCSVVPHAREVKNSCVSGIEAEGWHVQAPRCFLVKRHTHEAIAKGSSESNRHNSIPD